MCNWRNETQVQLLELSSDLSNNFTDIFHTFILPELKKPRVYLCYCNHDVSRSLKEKQLFGTNFSNSELRKQNNKLQDDIKIGLFDSFAFKSLFDR